MFGVFQSASNLNPWPPEGAKTVETELRLPWRGHVSEMVAVDGKLYVAAGYHVYGLVDGAFVKVPFQEDLDAIAEHEKKKNAT